VGKPEGAIDVNVANIFSETRMTLHGCCFERPSCVRGVRASLCQIIARRTNAACSLARRATAEKKRAAQRARRQPDRVRVWWCCSFLYGRRNQGGWREQEGETAVWPRSL
jgi:hypothetical protein